MQVTTMFDWLKNPVVSNRTIRLPLEDFLWVLRQALNEDVMQNFKKCIF